MTYSRGSEADYAHGRKRPENSPAEAGRMLIKVRALTTGDLTLLRRPDEEGRLPPWIG